MAIDHKTITDSEKHTPKGYPDTGSPGTNHVYQYNGSALEFGLVDTGNIAPSAVTTVKLDDGAVTNDKVATGTLGAEKLQTGAAEDAWVSARIGSKTVTASSTVRWVAPRMQGTNVSNDVLKVPSDMTGFGPSVIITASGTVRSVISAGSDNATVSVFKNNVLAISFSVNDVTGVTDTQSISVSIGDVLQISGDAGQDTGDKLSVSSWTLGGDAEFTV